MENIKFEDFEKLDIRIGKILSAERMENTDKLIAFSVDVNEEEPRTIVSGIAEHYPDPSVLVGRYVPVLVNLVARTIRGRESNGMILYIVGENTLTTLEPSEETTAGTAVR